MAAWMAAAGLVAVAAITPGPNNLIVMREAARSGPRGAAAAAGAVVLGSVALLLVVVVGGDFLFRSLPGARTALAVAGTLYLSWHGGSLVAASFRRDAPPVERALPVHPAAVFAFQLLNPKGWAMALAATSAVAGGGAVATLARLLPLFVIIPAISLAAWSSLGSMFADALARRRAGAWGDRAMGALLLASALLLLVEA